MKLSAFLSSRLICAGLASLALGLVARAQTSLTNAQVGQSYSYQVTTTPAAPAGTTYSATGLPAGLSIGQSSGLVSGTPTTAGSYSGNITLTYTDNTKDPLPYTLVVNPATGTPAITSATTITATAGTAIATYTVTASNSPLSFNVGALPAGLSQGGTTTAPTITGTPTTAGTYQVALSANNSAGTGSTTTLTITVNPAGPVPAITSATTATGTPNTAFSYTITASNSPLSFSATGLPLGLSLNSTTGVISGTPTASGVSIVGLRATNNNGNGATTNLTLTVGALSSITSATSATGGIGNAFTYTVTASNTPTSFNVTGLPAGLSANSATGVISGTPTTAGSYSVSLSANNGVGTGPATSLALTVGNVPTISSSSTATGTESVLFTYSIVATNSPTSYSATGLPAGLSLNSSTGVLSGFVAAGNFSMTLSASNSFGTGPTFTLGLTVAARPPSGGGGIAPSITTQPTSQSVALGASATFNVTASGPSLSYQWYKNGVLILGAISSSYTIQGVRNDDVGGYSVVVSNGFGSVTSSLTTLSLAAAVTTPQITAAPVSQSALVGASVTFNVTATGSSVSYQWNKNGTPILGATGAALTLSNLGLADAGSYSVTVSNSAGSTTSAAGVLGVAARPITGAYFGSFGSNGGTFALYVRSDRTGVFLGYARAAKIPLISRDVLIDASGGFQVSVTVTAPTSAAFDAPAIAAADATYVISGTIGADGAVSGSVSGLGLALTAPATASGTTAAVSGFYQAGASGSSATTYTIVGAAGDAFVVTVSGNTADAGKGTVNAAGAISVTTENNTTVSGSIQAATVSLTVGGVSYVGANNDARVDNEKLLNISTLSQTSSGANLLIAGFVITGTQPKPVLVRAIGPTLGQFGVGGALSAARLEVFKGSTSLKVGTDWGAASDAATIAATAARVGAFALAATSRDAALLLTLDPGSYTAIVSGQNNVSGVCLVEVYDATSGTIPNTQRIVNISSRAAVSAPSSPLIGGFYVSGTVPKRVLIRGVGPGLAQFGLTGTLARPQLQLFKGSQVVATNSGWTTSPDAAAIAAAATQVGAFAFPAGSADAAILVNLDPGPYTAQVAGVGGSAGIALVEIYEIP